jgi:hypothetical protein
VAVLLGALGAAAAYEELPRPTIGMDFDEQHTDSRAEIYKVGNMHKDDWPETGLIIPVGFELEVYGYEATGDYDTRVYYEECPEREVPLTDTLHADWPKWTSNFGTWPYGDRGEEAVWLSPESGIAASITLWENDYPASPARDDHQEPEHGIYQDRIGLTVMDFVGDVVIRSSGPVSNGAGGPDSQGALGLWVDASSMGKHDWRLACVNYEIGDHQNGSASYVLVNKEDPGDPANHPFGTGTGLKTEMYAAIDTSAFEDMPFVLDRLNNQFSWRMAQQYCGTDEMGYYQGEGEWYCVDDRESAPPPVWELDGYSESTASDGCFELGESGYPSYFYFADAPSIILTEALMDKMAEEGGHGELARIMYRRADYNFRTWLELCSRDGGGWHAVTSVPEEDEYWTDGRPMWGYTATCHRDELGSSWWHVEIGAASKTYGE